ncbi:unnamed protein product [Haemonchus placei]|uniref:Aldo_ket_red domain-containing protein n=1 Tax=Haemonchus placei TaxID=6290 RepID=A0A0N4VYS2_HAEPC|nr:unnamed protein product [Haemonchus placei]
MITDVFLLHMTWPDVSDNSAAVEIMPLIEAVGFMSKILLIEPDWQHKDKELPDKFVAKILTQLAMQKLTAEVAEQKKIKNVFSDPEFMATLEKRQKKASTLKSC